MSRTKTILFLSTEDWFFYSHRLFLAIEAKKNGYRVVVASRFRNHALKLAEHGIETVHIELNRKSLSPLTLFQEVWKVAKLYRRTVPDIVYHLALKPVVVGGLAARFCGQTRIVSAFAGLGYLFACERRPDFKLRVVRQLIYHAAVRGICLVENREDKLSIAACGISERKIKVLPGSGVNVDHYTPCHYTKPSSGWPVVMMASRLIWPKGVGIFVDAVRICLQWKLPAKFVLVGEPDLSNPDTVPLDTLNEWTSEGLVEWLGARADMNQVLSHADIFCLPTVYREGMPKVLLEAMACGIPCITTDTQGCQEAVRHEQNGLLIPPNDSQALALAIRRLLSSKELRLKMSQAGRQIAVAEYDEAYVSSRTMSLFHELLKHSVT